MISKKNRIEMDEDFKMYLTIKYFVNNNCKDEYQTPEFVWKIFEQFLLTGKTVIGKQFTNKKYDIVIEEELNGTEV